MTKFNFPTNEQEAKEWLPYFTYKPIHHQVLVVAKTRIEGTWKAYVTPVPGINHDEEMHLWRTKGTELIEEIARILFPKFKDIPYAK